MKNKTKTLAEIGVVSLVTDFDLLTWRPDLEIIKIFEIQLALYTGAPYAVVFDSCTSALEAAFVVSCAVGGLNGTAFLPENAYQSIKNLYKRLDLNHTIVPAAETYFMAFQSKDFTIYGSALKFKANMFKTLSISHKKTLVAISFTNKPHISLEKGGAILLNNYNIYKQLQDYKFNYDYCWMGPETAAAGIRQLTNLIRKEAKNCATR